jgi:putative protease
MDEVLIGKVINYFPRIEVAALEVTGHEVRLGDEIRILGHTTSFTQEVTSMQIDNETVVAAGVGELVGIEVTERARPNDLVYRISPR